MDPDWLTQRIDAARNPPFATPDLPGVPARFRSAPEDFVVEEVPAYEACGEGDHLFVFFEKRDLNTPEAVKRLALEMKLNPSEAGWAGLKDRFAVTRQWASFLAPPSVSVPEQVEGVRVLSHSRHGNKLRTGHLRGNHFEIRLRNVEEDSAPTLSSLISILERDGLPNYFGAQRFGIDGQNIQRAVRWLIEGGRAPKAPFQRKMLASALQSALFNQLLGERLQRGDLHRALQGDLMRKEETGGLFVAEDAEQETHRVERWETSPTGPMFGPKMREAEHEAGTREQEILKLWGLSHDSMGAWRKIAPGTRRPLRVRPGHLRWKQIADQLELSFDLPAGSYATTLVREITKHTPEPPITP